MTTGVAGLVMVVDYDRFLNKNGEFVHSVMLAFAGQRVPDVYGGKFDYVPDALCTEHGFEME